MKKPEFVFGIYDFDELKWHFFAEEQSAIDFQLENENRIEVHRFTFDDALQQFSNDLCTIDGELFVTEDEFVKVVKGEEVELSFFSSEIDEDEASSEVESDDNSKPKSSEDYFEDTGQALDALRVCCIYLLDKLNDYAIERDDDIETFYYYDDFIRPIESLVEDYLGDPEDFEQLLNGLYDGDFINEDEADMDD